MILFDLLRKFLLQRGRIERTERKEMQHTVHVTIQGISPLIQNNPTATKPRNKRKNQGQEIDEEEVRLRVYYRDDGGLFHPAEAIESAILEASREFHAGRRTYEKPIKRGVFINQTELPIINRKTWDRIRLLKPRNFSGQVTPYYAPEFAEGWEMTFVIEFDDEMVPLAKLKEILDFAGARIGIGVHRPKFGRFIVTKFEDSLSEKKVA